VLNRQTEIARKLAAELALPPAQRNRVGPYGPENVYRRAILTPFGGDRRPKLTPCF
jgi:hypothetical protein